MRNPDIKPTDLLRQFAPIDPSGALIESFIHHTNPDMQVVPLSTDFLILSNLLLAGYALNPSGNQFDLADLAGHNPNGILASARFRGYPDVQLLLTARQGELQGLKISLVDPTLDEKDKERLFLINYVDIGWGPTLLGEECINKSFRKRWETTWSLDSASAWFYSRTIERFDQRQQAYYMPRGDFPQDRIVTVTSTPLENGVIKLAPAA